MNFPSELLPFELRLLADALLVAGCLVALYCAPWRALRRNAMEHVLGAALVSLLLLWSFHAGVSPGLGFHFLGVTVLTLMFGWALALLGTVVIGIGMALFARLDWAALAATILLVGVLPVLVSHGIQRLVTQRLPANPFIYIFLCGFFGAILSALCAVMAVVVTLVALDVYPFERIAYEYLPFLPLYLFPEGLMNGMLTAVFVGMKPEWLRSFDESRYFRS